MKQFQHMLQFKMGKAKDRQFKMVCTLTMTANSISEGMDNFGTGFRPHLPNVNHLSVQLNKGVVPRMPKAE